MKNKVKNRKQASACFEHASSQCHSWSSANSTIMRYMKKMGPKYIYIYKIQRFFFGGLNPLLKKYFFDGPKALAWRALPLGRPCLFSNGLTVHSFGAFCGDLVESINDLFKTCVSISLLFGIKLSGGYWLVFQLLSPNSLLVVCLRGF